MKGKAFCLLIALVTFQQLRAQTSDSTWVWADRLLDQEIAYPVLRRLDHKSITSLSSANRLATALLLNLEFDRAQRVISKADSLTRGGPASELALLHINKARLAYDLSDYPASLTHGQEAIRLLTGRASTGSGSQVLTALAHLERGKSFLQQRLMKESRTELESAYQFFKADSAHFPIKLAHTYFYLGLWCKNNDRFEEAITNYEHAIALFEDSPQERYYDLGRSYNNLGTTYNELGDYGPAKKYYLQALEVKQKHVTDSLSLAITWNNLGKFYYDYGNWVKARAGFERSISLLNENNPRHRERVSEFLNNYASLLTDMEEIEEAEHAFRRCLGLAGEGTSNVPRKLTAQLSLAGLMINEDRIPEAETFLNEAGKILSDSQSNKRSLALWELRRASIGTIRNAPDNEKHYRKALSLLQPANTVLAAEAYMQYGMSQFKQRRYKDALRSYQYTRSILTANLSPTHPGLCQSLNLLGECHMELAQYDSALYYINHAIGLNLAGDNDKDVAYPLELITSYYFLSEISHRRYKSGGNVADLNRSAEFLERGLRAIDARRKSLAMTNDQLSFDQRVFVFFERALETYEEINRQTGSNPELLSRAFQASELAKSQALGQSLRESRLRSFANVTQALQQEEETLRGTIRGLDLQWLKERTLGQDANEDLLHEYQDGLTRANARYLHLQDSIRRNLPGYYQLKYNKTLVTSADLQRDVLGVMPGAALIQFMAGDSAVYVHILTSKSQKLYRVDHAQDIKARVMAFRNQIRAGIQNGLMENAGWLYDKLLSPAKDMLASSKKLIVVPDQFLCYLPVEALAHDGKYLVHRYDISYAYSSTLLWQKFVEKPEAGRSQKFLGFAPEFTGTPSVAVTREEGVASRFRFEPLEGNRGEVDAIRKELAKKKLSGSVLEGVNATEAGFRRLNLREYDYVHFATHGFVDMDNPRYSGVAFAQSAETQDDNILFTNEVYEIPFNAQLVCLSSCDSGLGRIYRGEGMTGLAQAFLYAGARNLAVSLWKVDDLATRDLMIDFYRRIPGKDLASALTSAKRRMASTEKYAHPYYWSAFVLIGN